MNLNSELSIISLANDLGLGITDPVNEIRTYCLRKVKGFIDDVSRITDTGELQSIICSKRTVSK